MIRMSAYLSIGNVTEKKIVTVWIGFIAKYRAIFNWARIAPMDGYIEKNGES